MVYIIVRGTQDVNSVRPFHCLTISVLQDAIYFIKGAKMEIDFNTAIKNAVEEAVNEKIGQNKEESAGCSQTVNINIEEVSSKAIEGKASSGC